MVVLVFLIVDLCFLNTAVIAQVFIPPAKIVIPTRIPTQEAKADIKLHPVIVKVKISKCWI